MTIPTNPAIVSSTTEPATVLTHCPASTPVYAGGFVPGEGFVRQTQNNASLRFSFILPVGATVAAARVGIRKVSGAPMPGLMPHVSFFYFDYATGRGAGAQVGSVVGDTPRDPLEYTGYHLVGPSGLSHTVAAGRVYYLSVVGDSNSTGLNAKPLDVFWPVVDLIMPSGQTAS